ATSLTCPECGRTAKSPRQLQKYRRDWGRVAFGVILIIAGAPLTMSRRFMQTGWLQRLPNFALIWLVEDPCIPNPRYDATTFTTEQELVMELWRRYAAGTLSLAQRRRVAAR